MITSVRFPTPITLVKNGNPHTEWKPGADGVREIRRENGVLVFTMDDGTERTTCLCGGMVIEGRGGDPFVSAATFVEAKAIANGPAGSPPSADPPPARPIRKGR